MGWGGGGGFVPGSLYCLSPMAAAVSGAFIPHRALPCHIIWAHCQPRQFPCFVLGKGFPPCARPTPGKPVANRCRESQAPLFQRFPQVGTKPWEEGVGWLAVSPASCGHLGPRNERGEPRGGRSLPDAVGGDVQRVPLSIVVDVHRQAHVGIVGRVEVGDGSAGDSQASEDCGQTRWRLSPRQARLLRQPPQRPSWVPGPPYHGAEAGLRMGSLLRPLGFHRSGLQRCLRMAWPELKGLAPGGRWAGEERQSTIPTVHPSLPTLPGHQKK